MEAGFVNSARGKPGHAPLLGYEEKCVKL